MRSLSPIRSLKKHQLQLQLPSILSCSSVSYYLSSNAVSRANVCDSRKSKYDDHEYIIFHKRKSCTDPFPDLISFSMLMNSYSNIGCTGYGFGVLGLILKFGYIPHIIGMSSRMNALCKQFRINEAALLFQRMNTHLGCATDIVAYGILLKGLYSTGNSRIALHLHQQIVDGTYVLSAHLRPDLIRCSAIIDGLCKEGLIDEAKELFLEMKSDRISPDVRTYNSVISDFCGASRYEEAKAMRNEMLDQGLAPDVVTFTVLINALAKMRKGKEAKEILILMIRMGQTPNVLTYTPLMDCFYMEGSIEELKLFFVSKDRKGIMADVISYRILIKGYCKHGKKLMKHIGK